MPRFAANLHYLFNEVPFLDRFAAAARAGFRGVEFQVPYQFSGLLPNLLPSFVNIGWNSL
jgi:hydroxypyruvate isomerase